MITFEELKEMFKESIDTTDTMNQAIENLMQSIYLKGYTDGLLGQWIPVSDPPKTSGRYLAYIGNSRLSYIMSCYYTGQTWCPDDKRASNNVVYWMPLPVEPYEEKKGDKK